jgi:hypothetical protein
MKLWVVWYQAIALLRSAFSRQVTFLWFALAVMGISVRRDKLGVTSIVRSLALSSNSYNCLLDHFRSEGINLKKLVDCWTLCVFSLFGSRIERVNGKCILLADGKKIAKEGRKMPAVKLLHQESDNVTKPSYIMGHSTQAVSLLARAADSLFAVPLDMKIHEGLVFSNRSRKTLYDKLLDMISQIALPEPFYLVADAYYCNSKMVKGMLSSGNHLITRARSNSTAYFHAPAITGKRGRGRPKKYGRHVRLKELFNSAHPVLRIASPVYGEKNVMLKVRSLQLLWKPAGGTVHFVLVDHPHRGKIIMMTTDLELSVEQVIRLYGLRFKIELGFKQASQVVGTFDYRFWMKAMVPLKRGNGDQYLHRQTEEYRRQVRMKMQSYHVHLLMGLIAQGLMQYLSACHTAQVWNSFGSWLRTIRSGVAPSELVVSIALQNTMPEFLLVNSSDNNLAKFVTEHQDPDRAHTMGIAA